MRVMKKYNSVPDNSCDPNSSFGQAEDYTVEVGGGGGAGGETCDAPIAVTALPYDDAGNTADYGNNYSSGDVPPVATGAVTTGTGSTSYLNGDDVVYAYTPADDEVLNISTTNDDDWIGLWTFTGCPFTSTVGYHTATGGSTRSIEGLPVTAGETYYFVISTWAPPQSTDYTIHIESVGGDPDPSAYCIPEGTNSARYIDNFSTTGGTQDVSNMGSGFSPDGYGDFYDTHNVAQAHGEDVQFEVDIEGGTAGFRIWVDWNQDGVFDTTEEVAYASTSYSANHTGSFTVPADALEGDTRMRIVSHWLSTSGDIDPCETGFTYGEFEDYKFTVGTGGGMVYCIPEGTNSARYIDNFSTTGGTQDVSNMGSGFSPDGYGDFYDTYTVAQEQGEDVAFEVDIEGGTAGFRIWVDWNQDGVFDTTEEVAYASTSYSADHTGSFTVPADALEGDTRMRIVSHWLSSSGDIDPCETGFTYGEFEDYKFTVEAGTGGGGGGPCSQGTASNNIENGWGNVSLLIYANDFVVVEDEEFTLEEMVVNFLLEPGFDIVSADIFFYEDTGGNGPGAEIPGTSSLGAVPVSQEIIDVHPAGFNLIEGIWTLDTPITFEGAAGDAVYWMGIEIEYAGASAFLETSSIYNTPNESYFSDDGGVTWTSGLVNFGDDMHGVITFSGQCEANGGGGGTACEQVFYDAVQPTGVGFSSGNAVANDITVAAGESFTMETMTFDVVNIAGLPSEFDLEIYEDNGSGGVGTTTGMTYHFDSSNMTFVENGTFSIYTQYTVTLTLPNIELTADASEDARYWLAIAADLTTTGDFTYWVSYDYVTNPDSYPSWQYNDTDGWFVYDGGSSEGIMTVSGMCEGAGSGDGCEWTVIVQDTSWGDEVEWELREIDGTVLLSGGGYGNGYYDEQSVTAAGPLEFWITNDGFFGDNTPTYSVSNGTEVLVSGTLETAETLIFSDLNCDSGDPGITYCEPELDCSDGDMITNVTFQEIDNTTVCSPNGYGDYTHLVATVESGETYPISVTVGDGWHNESVSVWIDFDNSGTFDEDEFFFIGTGSDEALTGDIDIPTELAEGQYRMRVRVAAVGAGTATWDMACDESQGYGETEDYTVEVGIGGGDPCDAVDVPYVQDFETATPPDMPECTTVVNAGSGNNWKTSTDEYGDFTGTFLEYEYHASAPANSWFFTQGINLEAGTDYEITYGYGSRAASAFPENLKVAFGDDNDPDAMTNLIAEHVAILSGGDKIMNTVEFTATTSGVFYFGFQAFSGANEWYLYLDDIEIKEADSGGGGSDCISTIYDGGNNGSPGGAVYFDVTVGPEDIELTSFDLNTDLVGTGFSVDVYTIEGTHVGNETNQGAWTMRTSGSGTSAGEGSPSTATLDDTFVLSANTTYGIALVLDGTHSHYYTNGDGTNEHFENSDLALDLGAATNTPFSGTVFTPRVFNGGLCYNVGGGGTGDDCDQGDDSNGFENGYNITAGGDFRNADDFIVSAGNTLNVRSIVLNVFANEPVSSVNINFFEDDGGMPGSTIVESVSGLVPYAQVPIGSNFGYTIYGVYLEVDLNFAGGASGASYWMQPEAVTDVAFWEVTSLGSLGELIHTSEAMGPWMPDEDGVNHAVFKLHCEVVTAPDPGCLFDITASVEPITRVVLAGIDNTSSAVVNGSPALEDFTHIEGTMGQGTEYDIALEGNTDGNWTNYFTVWIDWDQNGVWEADEMYEIGSITNSTGTDGQQATGTITVPADAPLGSTTMRVIKSFGSSPTDPCGQYSFGQGEDYTIIVEEGVGIDDQSMTTFTYYPNPTSGIVNITANKDISSVSVVNILGQQVIATKSLDNGQVDLSALATGTYMFRVTFEDGSLETFKVLKE